MLIAQITDLHVGFERDNPDEYNTQRVKSVLNRLVEGPNRPDMLLLTGDLTEFGDAGSYARLADMVSICPFPVWPMAGNHDLREHLLAAFPHTPNEGGFIHYTLDRGALRVIVLDTLEPGRHGGGFCAARAEWLAAQLAIRPEVPVVIAMHHPPFESGISWLDSGADEPWIARFAETIAGCGQIRAIISGHLHRTIHTLWNGVSLTVCPSAAPAVALDLNPIDPHRPDGRTMITDEAPAYALHRWDGARLIAHFETAEPFSTMVRYTERMQPVVQLIEAERR